MALENVIGLDYAANISGRLQRFPFADEQKFALLKAVGVGIATVGNKRKGEDGQLL